MGTGIELNVGEWYERRDSERVKVVVDSSDHGIDRGDRMIAIDDTGYPYMYFSDGSFVYSEEDGRDIIKHLPGCDGWGWQEPKPEVWRDATPEDAISQPHPRCRVKLSASNCRAVYAYGVLVGYYLSGGVSKWVVSLGGNAMDYGHCEVLDEPAVPPSAECEVCGGTGEADSGAPRPQGGFFTIPCECLDTKKSEVQ